MGYSFIEVNSGEDSKIFFDESTFYRLVPTKQADFFVKMLLDLAPNVKDKIVKTQALENHVDIEKEKEQSILAHQKIKFISYPHEWCASMLKDAALFHLELQHDLVKNNLHLKDAHPWNIQFEKGSFKFVDVP